jgi:peroxiredoxin
MRLRPDVLIFAVLIAGSAWVIWSQLGPDPSLPASAAARAPIGAPGGDFALQDISDQTRTLASLRGAKATVLYFWSVDCPCTEVVEMRMKRAMETYEPLGVAFVAIDSHPEDGRADVIEKMSRLHAPYRMLLDPTSEVARTYGVTGTTDVVVLDAEGRIRYRGAPDDDLMKPKVNHLHGALDAVLQGRKAVPAETRSYGCPFPGFEGVCTFP